MKFKKLLTTLTAVFSAITLTVVSGCALIGSPTGAPLAVYVDNIKVEDDKSVILEEGEGAVLTTNSKSEVKWVSESEKIARVSAKGKVTGVSEGETSVFAVSGNRMATCKIKVVLGQYSREGYAFLWHDEFEGNNLSGENWEHQLGRRDHYGNSTGALDWGNSEWQYYREDNATVEDGALVITAQKEEEPIDEKYYTSSRISTRDRFSFTYGYVEARIKVPAISGMWPAFWMLPQPSSTEKTGNEYGGWPANGELDIMEVKGRLANQVITTLHYGAKGNRQLKGETTTLNESVENWHVYAVDWTKEYIAWLIDGEEVFRLNNDEWWTDAASKQENPSAPFDKPFYILLNLAVGGNFDPAGTSDLGKNEEFTSACMYVDYVRVYQKK